MRKYNVAIHVLFWALIVFLLFITLLYLFYRNDGFNIFSSYTEGADPEDADEIVVREVVALEKEVESVIWEESGASLIC